MTAPSVTCPRCGMTSHHPDDVAEGYCGNCHDWISPQQPKAPPAEALRIPNASGLVDIRTTTAEELAQLLTREVRIIGDPKILRCHAGVFEALWLALPEADPMPPYEPPDFLGPGMISRLLSIPVITDEDYAPGEWRLVRASDDSLVHEGVIA